MQQRTTKIQTPILLLQICDNYYCATRPGYLFPYFGALFSRISVPSFDFAANKGREIVNLDFFRYPLSQLHGQQSKSRIFHARVEGIRFGISVIDDRLTYWISLDFSNGREEG